MDKRAPRDHRGRFVRAKRPVQAAEARFRHSSETAESEPDWGDVDKTRLPRAAFADTGEANNKTTWAYPHHWIEGGGELDEDGIYTSGTMYLHGGGLDAAWSAAQGGRSGETASAEVREHLATHRRALGKDQAKAAQTPSEISLPAAVELTAAAGEGRLPRLAITAYTGRELDLDGWPAPVVVHADGLTFGGEVPVLADHDPKRPIGHGRPTVARGVLRLDGVVSMPAGSGVVRDFLGSARAGFPWKASLGARPRRVAYHQEGSEFEANGRRFTAGPDGMYEVQEAALREVSILTLGADADTRVAVAARAAAARKERETMDEFTKWLKAQGKDAEQLSEEERTELKARYEAEAAGPQSKPKPQPSGTGGDSPPTPDAVRAAATAAVAEERRRVADIEAACRGLAAETVGDLKAKAVSGELSVDGLRQALLDRLRESRPAAPAVQVGRGPEGPQVLEAALCLAGGVGDEKGLLEAYGEQALNQADRYRRIGLRRTIELAAAMSGVELPLDPGSTEWIRAAFSTGNLPGMLGNVANKALAESFLAVRQVAPRIARAVSHTNFHLHTVYSLALSGDMEQVAPDGELKHLSLSEESWTRQLETRGAVLSISRQDLINDELGAFVDNGRRLGRKAAIARERATALLLTATGAGASHFTAARGNYQQGAATALSYAGLTAGVQLFRDLTGPDGDPISVDPRILLVPTGLEEVAKSLTDATARLIATALGSTSSKERSPNVNVWAGEFEPVAWEWLSKTIGDQAGSSKAWYLLADPADVPAVELAYLNGQQMPTVEYFGLSQQVETLGVAWRCYYDFGAALGEYRAGVKSKGEA